MQAKEPGKELRGCEWVGIPFAGGMCEVPYIDARTIVVNDLHRHVMNLAGVIGSGLKIEDQLPTVLFHPDSLTLAQAHCREMERAGWTFESVETELSERWAINYFIAVWQGRSSKAGTDDEFSGGLALRWNAGGGDSAVRYQSAIDSIAAFRESLKRCTFSTLDCFEWFKKVHDMPKHGLYSDPPWLQDGDEYKHKFTEAMHRRLAEVN